MEVYFLNSGVSDWRGVTQRAITKDFRHNSLTTLRFSSAMAGIVESEWAIRFLVYSSGCWADSAYVTDVLPSGQPDFFL